jgi:hypothetical protein
MAKNGMISYTPRMKAIPDFLNKNLQDRNFMLLFPFSESDTNDYEKRAINNNRDFIEIGKIIRKVFK